ncbi:peroxiredoxin family protein [Rubripirellula reticaptiva]|uniref:thioredoxin-dependent peroxiredoxin n=1 Tax=Rubripirellula reticaptiva TaxID=2528013 RepID=A0A5C6EGM7_9BACT|nr:peroxiredoxin family protein [Rubripirellula reticaptiva]TWU46399.1 thiol-disulfide oxidoreductase [Rubripirellula reticaptiva]
MISSISLKQTTGSLAVVILLLIAFIGGCDTKSAVETAAGSPDSIAEVSHRAVVFKELVASNREDDNSITDLSFIDTNGDTVALKSFEGKQNVLLVFTRGFSGMLCPFCTTQTSRLIANYDEFKKRNTEVLLVYPGSTDQLPEFQQASRESTDLDAFPFPVLLDEDLAAVKKLGIAAHLAFPSTFLIDRMGNVRLSYVGSSPSDRPSIKALLEQIDAIPPN